jgi:beta-glucanase (GH16 family)
MSNRADLWYGHYRFLVYVPDTRPLTCPQGFVLGLFTYRSDETNEIDIEFLRRIDTRQRNGCSFNQDVTNRIYTVAHTSAGSFPNPDTDHDQPFAVVGSSHLGHIASYGFDWSPAKITFLWNEQPIKTITGAGEVPRDPSHLMLNTWTGADGSGGGVPPKTPIHSRIYSVGYTPDFIPVPPPL